LEKIKNKKRKIIIVSMVSIALIAVAIIYVFFIYKSSVTKNTDSYIYTLPFQKGTMHTVVQGYGGVFSHKNIAAIDFEMPVGTPIYAARGGEIYSFKDDSDEGGPSTAYDKKANYIIIKHTDGSFGCYWHLKKNGVVIKKGAIQNGQLIGYSGATGFTLNPHLHFSVKLKLNYDKNSFVKTKFYTTAGAMLLNNRNSYERPMD
jgi:murein DD-endopeptidase MepM/ murein hydrolase activator NlpD